MLIPEYSAVLIGDDNMVVLTSSSNRLITWLMKNKIRAPFLDFHTLSGNNSKSAQSMQLK